VAALGPRQDRFAGLCGRSVDLVTLHAPSLRSSPLLVCAHAKSSQLNRSLFHNRDSFLSSPYGSLHYSNQTPHYRPRDIARERRKRSCISIRLGARTAGWLSDLLAPTQQNQGNFETLLLLTIFIIILNLFLARSSYANDGIGNRPTGPSLAPTFA
jgi:hypothetical protein